MNSSISGEIASHQIKFFHLPIDSNSSDNFKNILGKLKMKELIFVCMIIIYLDFLIGSADVIMML